MQILFQARQQANNDPVRAPLQETVGEDNIYDEMYELDERGRRRMYSPTGVSARVTVPSYYVGEGGH